jgi:hypothetical protein
MPAMAHYHMGFMGFFFFLAQSIGLSMIMGFVHIKTKQSILSAMMLHMLFNLTFNLIAGYSHTYEKTAFLLILAVGVVISAVCSLPHFNAR